MRTTRFVAAALLAFASTSAARQVPAPAPPDRYSLIRCGTLLAIPGQAPRRECTIVVKNDKIDSIVAGFTGGGPDLDAARKAGAKVHEINLRDSFVLPGLIDCHIHLTGEWDPGRQLRNAVENDADATVRGVAFCRKTVEAGFTTVRDLGATGDSIFALRAGIERGDIVGPRILASGKAVSITGGHGDPTNGYRADIWGIPGADQGVADGADECMKAVRQQIKRGADVIKITATGGVLSVSTAGLAKHFTDAELAGIVTAAHAMGRKVAAHAHGTDGINAALRAGVDSVEHASFQDAESIRLFKEKNAYYVPTLLAGETTSKHADTPGYYLPMVARKAKQAAPAMMESFRKAREAGIKIAFGTDSGVSPHGNNAQEFALMIRAGMSPEGAIKCATIAAADLLGIPDVVGTIEPGKSADIIAVKGDPLKDVTELERVGFVMRAGKVVKGAAPQ